MAHNSRALPAHDWFGAIRLAKILNEIMGRNDITTATPLQVLRLSGHQEETLRREIRRAFGVSVEPDELGDVVGFFSHTVWHLALWIDGAKRPVPSKEGVLEKDPETGAMVVTSHGLLDVIVERVRQIVVEGFDIDHDDAHRHGELASAASAYAALCGHNGAWVFATEALAHLWPFDAAWFKPRGRRRDLVRAAALLLAEIDRIDRIHQDDADVADYGTADEPVAEGRI